MREAAWQKTYRALQTILAAKQLCAKANSIAVHAKHAALEKVLRRTWGLEV
jgi:hypothetical protein